MSNRLVVGAAVALFGIAGDPAAVGAQEALERERAIAEARAAQEQARLEEGAERERTIEAARAELERTRRELEAAAREVARLSAGTARPFELTQAFRAFPRAVLGVSVADDPPNGARVNAVTPGSAAAEAGVATGDLITAIDGVELTGGGSARQRLIDQIVSVEPGETVALRILRDGELREVSVEARAGRDALFTAVGPGAYARLGGVPGMRATPGTPDGGVVVWNGVAPNIMRFERFLGTRWNDIELVTLTAELGSYFGTDEGLLVVRAPENDEIGLRDGDVILEIGGRTPTTPEHAMRILMSFEAGETLRLTIMRRERRQVIEYTIPAESRPG
jgi:S1-C subfamily serine protease